MTWTINLLKNHKATTIMVSLFLVLTIPLTLFQLMNSQEIRSRATGGAIAVILNPLTKAVRIGDNLDIQVTLNGGGNDVSAADITFTYPSDLLTLIGTGIDDGRGSGSSGPISSFSAVLNTHTDSSIHYVGVNPSNVTIVGSNITIGTLHFQTKAQGTASIGFSNIHINGAGVSSALPVDANATQIGTYTITQGSTLSPTPTSGPTATPTPASETCLSCLAQGKNILCHIGATNSSFCSTTKQQGAVCAYCNDPTSAVSPTPTTTVVPSPTASITPVTTPVPGANISLNLRLPGIGTGSGNNTAPKRTTRTATVALFDTNGQQTKIATTAVSYTNGAYTGLIPMGTLAPGSYEAKVKLENTLWKRIPGILTVSTGTQVFTAPQLDLISGDISGTNLIDLLSYNALLTCIQKSCSANDNPLDDLNDDGVVDVKDFNILLRAFSNRQGD